jgi:hypothetical protein
MKSNDAVARRLLGYAFAALFCAGLAFASIAPAAAETAGSKALAAVATPTCPTTNSSSTAENTPDLFPGEQIGPTLVTTAGKANRTLTADQATAWMQSWVPASVYEHLPPDSPPSGVPVSHLYMPSTYEGATSCIVGWYAVQGTQAWVGMPAQSLGFASVPKDTWIAAPMPAKTIAAFAGRVKPVQSAATPTTTTTTTTAAPATHSGSSGSSSWIWIVLAVVVIAAIGLWLAMRSRGRRRARTT